MMNHDAVADEPALFEVNATKPDPVGMASEKTQLVNRNGCPLTDSIETDREFAWKTHESTIIPFECPRRTASARSLLE
jgi:hypothetical protein